MTKMSTSQHITRYLSNASQAAFKAKASEAENPEPKPATPQLALLRRIKRVVFSPTTKTLEQALEKFETIVLYFQGHC